MFEIIGMVVPDMATNRQVCDIVAAHDGTLIDFYTMELEELQIIAKYRMLPTPTVLVIKNNRVVGRLVKDKIPTVKEFGRMLEYLDD